MKRILVSPEVYSGIGRSKVRQWKGSLKPGNARFGIVVAEFNELFTSRLLEGALDTLLRAGVKPARIEVFKVPGSFEIPLIVQKLVAKKRYGAVITLGVVIRGETRHFAHVVDAAAQGTRQAALECGIPVIHGVVAAENLNQAMDRSGGKLGNKGRDAARAALEMADLSRRVERIR